MSYDFLVLGTNYISSICVPTYPIFKKNAFTQSRPVSATKVFNSVSMKIQIFSKQEQQNLSFDIGIYIYIIAEYGHHYCSVECIFWR